MNYPRGELKFRCKIYFRQFSYDLEVRRSAAFQGKCGEFELPSTTSIVLATLICNGRKGADKAKKVGHRKGQERGEKNGIKGNER